MPLYTFECESCKAVHRELMSMIDAVPFGKTMGGKCEKCGHEVLVRKVEAANILRNDKIGGDGFKTGFNPGLGEVVTSRSDMKAKMKEKGLVEVGNDMKSTGQKRKSKGGFTANDIKELRSEGAELSDREADKLIKDTNE